MSYFLLRYRRSTAELLELRDLGKDRAKAVAERFAMEKALRTDPDVEVVILNAESRNALLHTHARYFKTISQLAKELSSSAGGTHCVPR